METINFLAQLLGFALVIIPLSLIVRPKIAKSILQMMENENALFIQGVIRVILGVALLLTYNVFDSSWKTIITVLGCLSLALGIGFLYFPSWMAKMIAKLRNSDWLSAVLTVVVLIGCTLLYFSFTA